MLLNCGAGKHSWESLDSKEIKQVKPKGNQPWIHIGRTDAEAAAPILWPPDVKSQFIGKDPDVGKDWWQKEKGRQKMRWLDGIMHTMDMNLSKLWETVTNREAWHTAVRGVTKSGTWLSNWTTTTKTGQALWSLFLGDGERAPDVFWAG